MESAETILVIILSATLTIFLIVLTIALVKIIQLIKLLKDVSLKAHTVVGNFEAATAVLKKSAGPLAIGKLLTNIFQVVKNHKKGK
jgi:hypothetical protein